MDDLGQFEARLSGLIQNLETPALRELARTISARLRESQSKRIGLQRNPDGTAYEPRKPQNRLRRKKGRLRRTMFAKIRQTKFLKASTTPTRAVVSFIGQVEAIARVHQLGLRDKVNRRRNLEVQYAQRRLLGISDDDESMLLDICIDHISR